MHPHKRTVSDARPKTRMHVRAELAHRIAGSGLREQTPNASHTVELLAHLMRNRYRAVSKEHLLSDAGAYASSAMYGKRNRELPLRVGSPAARSAARPP
jgi:hypothetical protein